MLQVRDAVARQTRRQSRLHRRAAVASSFPPPFFACLLYRFSILFHQDSVTHLSLFGCPETERKHRRDPAGIDGEHIREDVAPLSGVLLRINRVAPTSKRQIPPALLPPSWLNCHNRSVKNPDRVFNGLSHYLYPLRVFLSPGPPLLSRLIPAR